MHKFLHAADVHLDSPLLNLDRYDGAPVEAFRSATRRAFDNLVELAVREQVRFVLIAGDLYDGDCRDFNTPIHFRRRMEDLRSHGIHVFIIQGNHDAENKMRKAFQLSLPDNVTVFPTNKPITKRIDDLHLAIHGQGFAQREVTDDLSENYPDPIRGWLNIGMLHTSCGQYEGHDCYAPSTIPGLTRKGYDYWALGHIHKRAKLAGPRPWIVYPGNTQGRHIREDGARGCAIVTVNNDSTTTVEWRETDVMRWHVCTIDASELDEPEAILAQAEHEAESTLHAVDRPLAMRIVVSGATLAHRDLVRHSMHWDNRIRESMLNRFDDRVWIEKIKIRTRDRSRSIAWERDDDPLGNFFESISEFDAGQFSFDEVRDEFEQLLRSLPSDPRLNSLPNLSNIQSPAELLSPDVLTDAKELLLARLFQSEQHP